MAVFFEKIEDREGSGWQRLEGGLDVKASASGKLSGDFSLLRDVLGDNHNMGAMRVRLCAVDEEDQEQVRLVFPVYLYDFVEDTFARVLHHRIEGCGYVYRECVGRRTIRLREYDGLFRRVASEDPDVATEIAFARLLWDFDLAPGHRENYEYFLEKYGMGTVQVILERAFPYDPFVCLDYLCEKCLLTKETVEGAIDACGRQHAELVARLLKYKRRHWPRRQRQALTLEDL